MLISFTVPGEAQPAGSKRGFPVKRANGTIGVAISDANPKSKCWQHAVRTAALEAYSGPVLDCPLRLTVHFVRIRPKGHFGKGKKSAVLKASAPKWPTSKPDCTKLLRGLEDALTSIVWRDDAQIVEQSVSKGYGQRPEAVVLIEQLDQPF